MGSGCVPGDGGTRTGGFIYMDVVQRVDEKSWQIKKS